ncbi:LOB domain-containing protein 16-like [Solanum pennellii]|uniref:LOB domain-containing protein 16-like n=1 Tax=Solanum pennellii TaxID=28526 RepID=A0ABM1HM69_SOLPN|nr:LOB domain-containing protein 16-like [Solanum pennellii]
MSSTGTGSSPCGACKFLRRKCAVDCIFAPYFCSEQGPARFAAIHKVFGASNVSKLLLHVPVPDRCEAVFTIAYEAQARIKDPVYGCVAHIYSLQQQVAYLQAQLMQVKTQLAQSLLNNSRNSENFYPHQWSNNNMTSSFQPSNNNNNNPTHTMNSNSSPQSSLESIDHYSDGINNNNNNMPEIQSRLDQVFYHQAAYTSNSNSSSNSNSRKRPSQTELGELQALALRMMKN